MKEKININRNILIGFLEDCLNHAKRCCEPENFFSQAFGGVSLYCSVAYANGNEEEEKVVADLWNNEYRAKFEELVYGKVGE